jgi:nicotinamide-nucleotide amidase
MKAEIIIIGDEILIGQTVDTNSAWIGEALNRRGFDIVRKITIHDNHQDILGALNEIGTGTDVIITTGGLGPTSDDITKQTLCEFFGTKLVPNRVVLDMIEKMMKHRGIPMNENNRKQAEVPESCRVLTNAVGTAPGLWFEKGKTVFISLPGVPYEMKYIMNEHVLPDLSIHFKSQAIQHRNIMTYGVSESRLAEILTGFEKDLSSEIKLAYLPSYGIIKLRLTGTGKNISVISHELEEQVIKLRNIIPDLIFSEDEESFEMTIGRLLKTFNKTVCTAESCTGGNIARMLTSVPGSSTYFKGSVVAYDNAVKEAVLGISSNIIRSEGAVSEAVVRAMAESARKLIGTDFSVATSGIAGPAGGTDEKPVGTLWIAAASVRETISEKHTFPGDRITNIMRFSNAALNLLRRLVIRE